MSGAELRITFLGGAGGIGASSALVEVAGTALLVDCGVRHNALNALPDLSVLHGKPIDAIAVTHAHLDHTGALPVVCDSFPLAPIFATPPTIDIATILLGDALKLMSAADRDGEVPLYAYRQVAHVRDAFTPIHHGEERTIGAIGLTFLPASHILGASMLHLATPAGNLLITGDYSVSAQLTVPALSRPALPVDMVVTEATYGDRLHEDRDAAETRLVNRVREVVAEGGQVLIPAFAVGRAQEILLILKRARRNHTLPEIPIYVDGMVRAVCGVYGRHERYVSRVLSHEIRKAAHPFYTNGIRPVEHPDERREILSHGPCIIVASSGMLSGGASALYAAAMAPDPKNAILITGYQDEESPGRALLEAAESEGAREVKVGDRTLAVQCRIEKYGLSAHADRMEMIGLIESLRPRTVVMVHGNDEARRALAAGLSAKDLVLVRDGETVTRGFASKRPVTKTPRDSDAMDIDAARNLLGPPTGKPIRARQVADAWFGGSRSAEETDRFIGRLESLGLVRRDDHRRQMIFVLAPSETDSLPDEAATEEALKSENPKGKLLELCMRRRIAPPVVEMGVEGAFHTATMTIEQPGGRLESGRHRAPTKKTAEQLAARALLARIEAVTVDLPASTPVKPPSPQESVRATPADTAEAGGRDPMMLLNEMRQLGLLIDFGYDLREPEGPVHQPLFTTVAWAALESGERVEAIPVRSPTKKAGRREASTNLIGRLREMGLLANRDIP